MTNQGDLPESGHVRVNLAMQVAGIAASVTAALRSDDQEKRERLCETLLQARAQLEEGPAPEGLVPFIDVACGMLRGEDVRFLAGELTGSYRAVYEQMVDETAQEEEEASLTVRQVLEQVSNNVVAVMYHGSYAQRRLMANTLLQMERETSHRPDLASLGAFLEAARALLQDEDWAQPASKLQGPFQARWETLLHEIRDSGPTGMRRGE